MAYSFHQISATVECSYFAIHRFIYRNGSLDAIIIDQIDSGTAAVSTSKNIQLLDYTCFSIQLNFIVYLKLIVPDFQPNTVLISCP